MALDDKETQAREDLELSRSKSQTAREWLKTSVWGLGVVMLLLSIWTMIFRGIPALTAWTNASNATAAGWTETLAEIKPEVIEGARSFKTAMSDVAAMTGSGKKILTQAETDLPRAFEDVHRIAGAVETQVTNAGSAVADLTRNADSRINNEDGLIASVTTLVGSFNKLVGNADTVLVEIAKRGNMTFDELRALIGSPEWAEARAEVVKILRNTTSITTRVDGTAANFELTSAQIAKAMEKLPEIAQLIADMGKTAKKAQKALILARIFGLLAPFVTGLTF